VQKPAIRKVELMEENDQNERPRSGPFGMGQQGYLIALIVILASLIFALIFVAVTGRLPTHSGPHFP
jgi:hypothetical protein